MIEIFRPAVNLETQTNRKDTECTKKVQVGPFFGKNPHSFQTRLITWCQTASISGLRGLAMGKKITAGRQA
jgi:hypothetical protein